MNQKIQYVIFVIKRSSIVQMNYFLNRMNMYKVNVNTSFIKSVYMLAILARVQLKTVIDKYYVIVILLVVVDFLMLNNLIKPFITCRMTMVFI